MIPIISVLHQSMASGISRAGIQGRPHEARPDLKMLISNEQRLDTSAGEAQNIQE